MTLVLVHPDGLPRSEEEVRREGDVAGYAELARRVGASQSAGEVLDRLRSLPTCPKAMGLSQERRREGTLAVTYSYAEDLEAHDRYFEVHRIDPPLRGAVAHSAFVVYRSLIEEASYAGTRTSWAEWAALTATVQTLICWYVGEGAADQEPWVSKPASLRPRIDPYRRWRIGHHLFFVLTQGIIVALHCFHAALEEGDLAAAGHHLRTAGALLGGSAASFVFASEFGPRLYRGAVRPAMEPPFAPPAFSGLMSTDHRYLVSAFRELRPSVRALPAELAGDHERFLAGLHRSYGAHKLVCGRFGGDEGPSLRKGAGTLTAVDVIHALKLSRMKMVSAS